MTHNIFPNDSSNVLFKTSESFLNNTSADEIQLCMHCTSTVQTETAKTNKTKTNV